ncbi:MAG: PAS domain S-box protein [Planctomycetaceae bacterium]
MRILVADDDLVSLQILQRFLQNLGYEVVTATDGEQAARILDSEVAPRLAIVDWAMPGMTGIELCQRFSGPTATNPVHVILLTARTGNRDLVEGLGAGASDYIRKPFDPEELRARVQVGATIVTLRDRIERRMQEFEDYLADCPLGVLLVERDGSISYANARAGLIFGYLPDELTGQPLELLVPAPLRELHVQLRENYLRSPAARMLADRGSIVGQRRDGEMIPLAVGLNRIPLQEPVRTACTVLDLTPLRTAEEQLEQFFNLSLDIFCIASTDGYLLQWNPALSRLLGYPEAEMKSRSMFDFVHPDDLTRIRAEVQRLSLGGETVEFHCRLRSIEGVDFWIEWNAYALAGRKRIYAVGRDITDRIRAEEQLQYLRSRERLLLNNIPANISIKDLDGRYEFVNRRHAELISGSLENAVGKTAFEFFAESLALQIRQQETAILERREPITVEETLTLKDGDHDYLTVRFPLIDNSGSVCALASVSTDISETLRSRQMERELDIAQDFQRHLYPQSRMSTAGVEIAGSNRAASRLCGDYYDFFESRPQCVLVGVADVSGHGVGPALQMTNVCCLTRVLGRMKFRPENILSQLNENLCESLPDDSFVSMFLTEINLAEKTVSYLGAGHEGLLVQPDGAVRHLESTHGLLGIDPTMPMSPMSTLPIHAGEVLVLFTDGVWETTNPRQEQFGLQRTAEVIRQSRGQTPQEIIESVFAAMDEFTGSATHPDDATVVVVKFL